MPNLADHLFARGMDCADRTAIVFEDEQITYAELADRVMHVAGALKRVGIGAGARVGLMMASSPGFIVYQQAIFALGATFSPLNIFYKMSELTHVIGSCRLDYLVISDALRDQVPVATSLKAVIVAGDEPPSPPLRQLADMPPDAIGMLLNTSATTGKSKAVMLTLANIAANYDRTPGWLGLATGAVTLCALPLYNTFGLNQGINATMVTGGTLVIMPRFDAAQSAALIEQHGCTFFPAVPTMLQKIIDHPQIGDYDLRSVSRIMTGGAPVPAVLLERIGRVFGDQVKVLTGYGLTEATALVTLEEIERGADGKLKRPKSIGKILGGMHLRIVAEDGADAAPRDVGEIWLSGPNIMAGYFENPQDTAAIIAGGWLKTGDLGMIDEEGFAYIVDRKKDLIIRGGQNVYPAEIEDVIYQMPGVSEVAVVAAPHQELGEIPVAYVAAAPGYILDPVTIIDRCRAELAYFKVPSEVAILPELPKGPTGKILKRELRQGM
jgi:long-chain acyl-CoA synthetase